MNAVGTLCDVRAAKVGGGIDKANNVSAKVGLLIEAKSLGEGQVCAIATLLVPTLDSSTDGTGDDGHVEHLGNTPLVAHLPSQGVDLSLVQLVLAVDVVDVVGVLCHQGALLEGGNVLGQALLSSKLLDLSH